MKLVSLAWRTAAFVLAALLLCGGLSAEAAPAQPCADPHAVTSEVQVNYGEPGHPEHLKPVVFVRLPDGSLRAEDGETREELWSYTPPAALLTPGGAGPLGPLTVLRFDANNDGVIDPLAGDRVWIYFGLLNRGRSFVALDASVRTRARKLWIDSADKLPHLGFTWAQPTLARIQIAGTQQNGEQLIVLLAGGVFEPGVPGVAAAGSEGNRIYAVDAATGALLWHAGASFPDDTPDLVLPEMTFGLASQIRTLQLGVRGATDRLYASDTGGQIWRLDLSNNQPAAQFAAGGRLASLGLAEAPPIGGPDARQFFATPDVAVMTPPGAAPYVSIAIGSGNALSIDSATTQDRLYGLRDLNAFTPLDSAGFAALAPILDRDLPLVVTVDGAKQLPSNAKGWKLDLRRDGEKMLASGLTVDGVLMIPSFEPPAAAHACGQGTNRLYVLRVSSGRPALDLNDDGVVDIRDDSVELSQTNVAPEVQVAVSTPSHDSSAPGSTVRDALGREVQCTAGTETLAHCARPIAVIRTWWRRELVR